MKISVIIPTYRPSGYIFKCLESLENQVLNKFLFEVIIVLNGEEEPYKQKIIEFIRDKAYFRLFYSNIASVSNARNLGISVARYDYITFIDDDDFVSENYLQGLLNECDANINCIIQSDFLTIDFKNEKCRDYIGIAFLQLKNVDFSILKYRKFLSNVNGKLYHRSLISNVKFKVNLKISEDAVFLFELSSEIDEIKLVSEQDVIYYRSLREGSTIRTKKTYYAIFKNMIQKLGVFTLIYLNNIFKINFVFFITRLLAVFKVFIHGIKDKK